jgi:HAD superfamily hydrolase (TIGR01549 family)
MTERPADFSSIQWLFIDIGGPIINDDRAVLCVFDKLKGILIGKGATFTDTDFAAAQLAILRSSTASITASMLQCLTGTTEGEAELRVELVRELSRMRYDEFKALNPLRRRVRETLEALSKQYRLATLSNNASRIREVLRDYRVDKYFSIIGISESVGYSKPDLRFFRYMLDEAGCRSEEVMMVGDRIDTDIVPARRLGMYTAWVRVGLYGLEGPEPAADIEMADLTVRSLADLADILLGTG